MYKLGKILSWLLEKETHKISAVAKELSNLIMICCTEFWHLSTVSPCKVVIFGTENIQAYKITMET